MISEARRRPAHNQGRAAAARLRTDSAAEPRRRRPGADGLRNLPPTGRARARPASPRAAAEVMRFISRSRCEAPWAPRTAGLHKSQGIGHPAIQRHRIGVGRTRSRHAGPTGATPPANGAGLGPGAGATASGASCGLCGCRCPRGWLRGSCRRSRCRVWGSRRRCRRGTGAGPRGARGGPSVRRGAAPG